MALIGNRSVIHKNPMTWFSGTTLSGNRSNFNSPGKSVSRFFGGLSPVFGASPSGHLPPSGWVMPMKPGGISSYVLCGGVSDISGSASSGVNIVGECQGSCDAIAEGGLVSSATGLADGWSLSIGEIYGAAGMFGGMQGYAYTNIETGAIVWLVGTCHGGCDASIQTFAVGSMAGAVTPFTELSPEGLAGAVWGAIASENNISGTMGAKINAAASAGDPWTAELPGAYPEGSAGATVSDIGFLLKVLRNRREITKESGEWRLVVYDDDNATPILSKALADISGGAISDLTSGVLAREGASDV